ncbi:IS3 family transposase, partial [Escherichia coli]
MLLHGFQICIFCAKITQLIASIFHEHRGCYGYRRIHCELQK